MHLLVTASGLGLLLVLVLLVTGGTGQGLLKDLEDLLILDLLVALVLLEVDSAGSGELGDTVLGDGYRNSQQRFSRMRVSLYLTNGGQQARDGSVVSGASGLVLANDTAANTLDNADLGGLLVIKLAQAEGESAELLDNLGESLAGARTL